MWRRRSLRDRGRASIQLGLLGLVVILGVMGCGGEGGGQEAAPEQQAVTAENAEVGKTLEGEVWRVTLVDAPVQMKMVGGDVGLDPRGIENYIPGFEVDGRHLTDDDITANGVYIAVPIEIANTTDEPQMVTRKVLKIVDSAGEEYVFAQNLQHLVYVWVNERWMDDNHLIVPSVPDAGEVRQGPLLFDVPEDATGLKLVMEGSDNTIDLGF